MKEALKQNFEEHWLLHFATMKMDVSLRNFLKTSKD